VVAGVAFGQAGTLLHAGLFRTVDLPWLPAWGAALWLVVNAMVAWVVGRGLLSREAIR
jgi:hypothetical protein